ncbi:MAG: hypothetical protein LBT46_08580 [Planctomycetaceae bacterium]|jgi:hypothetical protein|nr:hypothetical protein [Planctomycetaceae bacterium]
MMLTCGTFLIPPHYPLSIINYQFVILLHRRADGEHWDVMLETESALDTWAIPPQKVDGSSFETFAEALPPHRKAYLDYEGDISGSRGSVRRIDTGTYAAKPQRK